MCPSRLAPSRASPQPPGSDAGMDRERPPPRARGLHLVTSKSCYLQAHFRRVTGTYSARKTGEEYRSQRAQSEVAGSEVGVSGGVTPAHDAGLWGHRRNPDGPTQPLSRAQALALGGNSGSAFRLPRAVASLPREPREELGSASPWGRLRSRGSGLRGSSRYVSISNRRRCFNTTNITISDAQLAVDLKFGFHRGPVLVAESHAMG